MKENRAKNVIVVAEDDDEDFILMERAFKIVNLAKQVMRARDGQDLVDYLLNSPRPDLILLDLNMPIKDGREALEEIKSNERLRDIPVVVLTTSKSEEDVVHSYRLGVNSFILKPARQKEFVEMIRALCQYWFETVELPHPRERERHD